VIPSIVLACFSSASGVVPVSDDAPASCAAILREPAMTTPLRFVDAAATAGTSESAAIRFETLAPLQQEIPSSSPAAASRPEADVGVASQPHFHRPRDYGTASQAAVAESERPWSFSYSALGYFVPEDRNVLTQIATADGDWLHLEARIDYEDLDTVSLFGGYNLSFGDELVVDVTPVIGGVFGNTAGVAPGLEVAVTWGDFEAYAEAEYVFDSRDSSDNFFYCWSELSYSPTDWLRFGVALQHTKVYETDLDIQRGPMIGLTWKGLDLTTYVFNLGWEKPTVVIGATFRF